MNSFEILQELANLTKKEESARQIYNKNLRALQKKRKKDKKKKAADSKLGVNISSLISAKNYFKGNDFIKYL